MRIAYLDCFAGIAGDMFLGALLDTGVPEDVLHDAVRALNVGASLKIERVDRSGISCTKVHVLEKGELAETRAHTHEHAPLEQHTHASEPLTRQPETQHQHKTGHPHTHEPGHTHEGDHQHTHAEDAHGHDHPHTHGRSLTAIRALIQQAPLQDAVKATAIRAFEFLGHSEAKIHNVPVEEIHFHEVGAVDAIVDIVASAAGIHHLAIGKWYSSPLNVGGGMVECAHGTFPVPAPATADLLRGVPTYSAHIQKELVTPTGAALLRALNPEFGVQPPMRVDRIGYGAGTRNPKDFPNVLRLSVGDQDAASSANESSVPSALESRGTQTVTVLETALDDATPQLMAFVAEQALAGGALDVMLTPVIMKKGRPGTLLTVLCSPEHSAAMQQLLLRETPTLGVRVRQDQRVCLDREHQVVETPYGLIRVKLGTHDGQVHNAAPEFEDCKAAALQHRVPLKSVQGSALAAYLNTPVKTP